MKRTRAKTEKPRRRLTKRKNRKKKKEDNYKETANRNNENRNNKNKTNVYILGDSIVKKLNGYLLTRKIKHKHLVKVRSFLGAKISCMTDHVKLTLGNINPDHMIPRLDDFNNKVTEVNRRLVLMCKERNISFFSHDESIDPSKHVNESKPHLNSNGIKIFAENFSRFLVKLN